ncbi:MAG: hypothetical protein HZA80_00170 [Candidatus Taylorbacteria bacterium]|nr:hypothetical protein [Candidatus Taylorbacteria bacterium]
METKFQTSFIPKKPLVPETGQQIHQSVSLFSIIGVLVFIISVAMAGGVFAWTKILQKQQESYKKQITHNREQFGTDIKFLERFNAKINLSRELINNHLAVANIFDVIGRETTTSVRFKSFDVTFPTNVKDRIVMSMKGEGTSLPVLAFQSDVFGGSKVLKDPVVSDFGIDDKGTVGFSFSAGVDPQEISFKKYIESALSGGTSPTDVSTPSATTTATSTRQ